MFLFGFETLNRSSDSRQSDGSMVPFGSLLCSPRGLYAHYGVWFPFGVFEFSGDVRKDVASATCRLSSFQHFADDRPVFFVQRPKLPSAEIVRRVSFLLGKRGYNLVSNNCEHVSRWVIGDGRRSSQVQNATIVAAAAIAIVAANAADDAAAPARRRCRMPTETA